jgi:hypothetical protein
MQLVAADSGYGDGLIYVSTNYGGSWAPSTAPVNYWTSVACSSDGSRLAAMAYPGGVYTWESIPALNVRQSGGNLFISWQPTASATGFILQEDADLATNDWVTVATVPVLTNGINQVVIPLPQSGNQFYRLQGP